MSTKNQKNLNQFLDLLKDNPMKIFKVNSAAQAFFEVSEYLLSKNKCGSLYEELNGIIVFEDFKNGTFEQDFDAIFRDIFTDERVDFVSDYTFMEPRKTTLEDGKISYEYSFLRDGWKNTYWGRICNMDGEHNQFENTIKEIKKGKKIKRYPIVVFHPVSDMKRMFGQPCLLTLDFKPRDGDLYMSATFRSQRISKSGYGDYKGLLKMGAFIAKETGLTFKSLTVFAHSLHIDSSKRVERENTKQILTYFSGNKEGVENDAA